MKKIIMMFALMMGIAVSAVAQTAIVDNGTVKDNWYVGGGVGTNVWNGATSWTLFNAKSNVNDGKTNSWWRTQPMHANVYVGKMVTPYVGGEFDYTAVFNIRGANPFLDSHNLTGNVVLNLTNIITGYNGKRRFLDVELLGGVGWWHNYANGLTDGTGVDHNALSVRGAVRTNFNVAKNLAITVTPEYVWLPKNVGVGNTDITKQFVNISVGVKYRIPTKRGNFQLRKLYNQSEVNALNTTIATLTKQNTDLTKANADLAETINKLVANGEKVIVQTNIQSVGVVLFEKGQANVNDDYIANVVKILKDSNGTIVLTGTTSPEGGEDVNKVLGTNRANAVKNALVASGIDESRIVIKDGYANKRSVIITLE